jgi:ABC-2 type transport system permease protein
MRNVWAIFRREFFHYFNSPIAYVVIALFLVIAGVIFWLLSMGFSEYSSRYPMYVQQQQQMMMMGGAPPVPNASEMLFGPFFRATLLWGLFATIPLLTMRLIAEEKRSGTIEMLFTYPIRDLEMIIGKYLAALSVFVIMLALTLVYPLLIYWIKPEAVSVPFLFSCYLGLFACGAAYIALGTFFSSVTNSQIVAAILGYGTLLGLFLVGFADQLGGIGSKVGEVVKQVSVLTHQENFLKGVIDSGDVIYFAVLVALSLFLTVRMVESHRWKG